MRRPGESEVVNDGEVVAAIGSYYQECLMKYRNSDEAANDIREESSEASRVAGKKNGTAGKVDG